MISDADDNFSLIALRNEIIFMISVFLQHSFQHSIPCAQFVTQLPFINKLFLFIQRDASADDKIERKQQK